jgi:hypothetical protein
MRLYRHSLSSCVLGIAADGRAAAIKKIRDLIEVFKILKGLDDDDNKNCWN